MSFGVVREAATVNTRAIMLLLRRMLPFSGLPMLFRFNCIIIRIGP